MYDEFRNVYVFDSMSSKGFSFWDFLEPYFKLVIYSIHILNPLVIISSNF